MSDLPPFNKLNIPEGSVSSIVVDGKVIWSSKSFGYVSLGDSIAVGHRINEDWETDYGWDAQYGVNGRTETALVSKCYTDLIRQELESIYGKKRVTVTSFARSGDRVNDLIEKLNHDVVRKAISKANYVTICIGANDVLEPALSRLEEYINTGSLTNIESTIENNFAALNDDNNPNSYTALFKKLTSINPNASYTFTTIYNPYKYLWLDEGSNGFFKPLLDFIPPMNVDVDDVIESMFGFDMGYWDLSNVFNPQWVAIELNYDLGEVIKSGLLSTSAVRLLFSRVNGLCNWAEKYVSRLNELLRRKINAYRATNPNFAIAETKALFDTYPDRINASSAQFDYKHYNDLVNVEYTRGYTTATMAWGELWHDKYGDSAGGIAQYWGDLAWKYLSFKNGFPSWVVTDYLSFDIEGFATDLVAQVVEKVIEPDVDPHPEEYGHKVLKDAFDAVIDYK